MPNYNNSYPPYNQAMYYPMQSSQGVQDFKSVVLYSVLGLGAATGIFYIGRNLIKKWEENHSERNSLTVGDPATFAKQLKMAFNNDNWLGWGTNTNQVLQVFENIPSKSLYKQVETAYSNMYGKSLNSDLESELSSSEYNTMISILSTKPN